MNVMMGILILGILYVFIEIYRETHSFVVTRYTGRTEKLPIDGKEKKIIFLSDFHNQDYGKKEEKLLRILREEKPDVILIGGDMLVGKKDCKYDIALRFIKQLPQIAPVYYANGNHEQRMHEKPKKYGTIYWSYKKELEDAGIRFLVNDRLILGEEREQMELIGIELPQECYERGVKYPLRESEITERIGTAGECYTILMAHHPAYASVYWNWGADLVFSGHLHGGVVRLPHFGAVISPQFHMHPQYSGDYYQKGNKGIVVSKGLGTHTIPIRLWNPAEMIVFTLKGEAREEDSRKNKE